MRDRIPIEWEEANSLYLRFPFWVTRIPADLHEVCCWLDVLAGFSGVRMRGRPKMRQLSWWLALLERSIFTAGLLEASLSDPSAVVDAGRMLRLTSSLQAYHRQRGDSADFLSVVHYLLHADDLPRSVVSCLVRTENCLIGLAARAQALDLARRKTALLRARVEFGELSAAVAEAPVAALSGFASELADVASDVQIGVAAPATGTAPRCSFCDYVRPFGG